MQNGSCHGPRELKKIPHKNNHNNNNNPKTSNGGAILLSGGVASATEHAAAAAANGHVTVRFFIYPHVHGELQHLK